MWQERAACAQVGGDIWHPEKNASTREAKEICLRCDAVQECLQWALDNNEQYGVWGGLSEQERRRLVKANNPDPQKVHACANCGHAFVGAVSAKYCSPKCYRDEHLSRRRQRAHDDRPERICAQCSTPFVRHGLAKYCTAACRIKANKPKPLLVPSMFRKNCHRCGGWFEAFGHRAMYCESCRGALAREKSRRSYAKRKGTAA